ncbi:helicase [Devosia epidermidihirudinis]|uniref:Helicase n=1 Tax=Devosia epidermidihirudinis TaxID=1293439 RepID=A0A0F5QG12_9HYPH|nr:DEAD/DEAH box helicase [Devosia epidermidihirudinis]KKC39671.1 helicase [Devosia epidermidihirudinis]
MSLPETIIAPLARALAAKGYETLTAVQSAIIEDQTAGRDLLVSAQTGSGKTVAFGMAIAPTLLDGAETFASVGAPLALVIAPTRELAMQVQRELEWLYAETGAKSATCVGGMDIRTERRALERGAHIVVGTPGRLRDHITKGALDMSALRAVVLDEADEMLDLGFREDLEFILDAAPEDRRTLLFSATVPKQIAQLAKTFQRDALRIAATSSNDQHADIDYKLMLVPAAERENAIINTLLYFDSVNTIVFASTREGVKHLSARLHNRGFDVVTLSGELSQAERTNALQSMRDGRARICVATDVAARGIDLPNLDLVIHADLPTNSDTLLHRSGRTGRAGRKGTCVIIAPMHRRNVAQRVLKVARLDVTMMAPPSAAEIDARYREGILSDAALSAPMSEDETAFVSELLARYTPDAIAAAYLRQQLAARPAPEDVTDNPQLGKPGDSDPRVREKFEGGTWFKVSVGRKHKAEPRWLLPMLCKAGNVTKTAIGSIRIFDTESHFEVAAPKADSFAKSVEKNGSGERGVTISSIDSPGERTEGRTRPPAAQRRPPGPIERYDPNAPRPERADRQNRYGSSGLRPDDFEAPATGGWTPSEEGDAPRAPRPDFDKPRAPKVSKAPPSKDKGKPKWAGKPAEGAPFAKKEKASKKDHKPKRKPQV